MKTIVVYILTGLLAVSFSGTAQAVEKKEKDAKKIEKKELVNEKQQQKGGSQEKAAKTSVNSNKTPAQNKFDSFIDKNNNGIDDRKENLKSKDQQQKKAEATKSSGNTDSAKKSDNATKKGGDGSATKTTDDSKKADSAKKK